MSKNPPKNFWPPGGQGGGLRGAAGGPIFECTLALLLRGGKCQDIELEASIWFIGVVWHAIDDGDHILVSLNILGTCLEYHPGYDSFWFCPFWQIATFWWLLTCNWILSKTYTIIFELIFRWPWRDFSCHAVLQNGRTNKRTSLFN